MTERGIRAVERRALDKLRRHPALRAIWWELVGESATCSGPGADRRRDRRHLLFGAQHEPNVISRGFPWQRIRLQFAREP